MPQLKRLDFAKNLENYSFFYDDIRDLINHLVDIADADDCNLDLMDIFAVVNRLAHDKSVSPKNKVI